MIAYVVRRLLSAIPTLFGVAVIIFVLFHLVGGDPTYQMVGKNASAQQLAEVRHEYGLDLPLSKQFLRHLTEIVTFNYPRSYATKQSIGKMIGDGIGPSLMLTVPAFILTTLIALALGLLVAFFRGRWIDKVAMFACVFGMSLSILAYILYGQYVLAFKLGLFPISGFESSFPESISFVALPALIFVAVTLGFDLRFYRAVILEETQQDYVRTARAKGLGEVKIYLKHVLKNSLVPVLTNVIAEIPLLILGSFLLEGFFSIPGLGGLTINAIHGSDFPVLKVMAMLLSTLTIFGNILIDIMYRLVDPRVNFQ